MDASTASHLPRPRSDGKAILPEAESAFVTLHELHAHFGRHPVRPRRCFLRRFAVGRPTATHRLLLLSSSVCCCRYYRSYMRPVEGTTCSPVTSPAEGRRRLIHSSVIPPTSRRKLTSIHMCIKKPLNGSAPAKNLLSKSNRLPLEGFSVMDSPAAVTGSAPPAGTGSSFPSPTSSAISSRLERSPT